jgi:hypothetical protein
LEVFKIFHLAAIASPEKAGVGGSTPFRGTMILNHPQTINFVRSSWRKL